MRPQLELLAIIPILRRGRLIVPIADVSAPAHKSRGGRRGRLIVPIASAQRSGARFHPSAPASTSPERMKTPTRPPWLRPLLLLILLLFSIALYIWLFNAALPGFSKITPFLTVWEICLLP